MVTRCKPPRPLLAASCRLHCPYRGRGTAVACVSRQRLALPKAAAHVAGPPYGWRALGSRSGTAPASSHPWCFDSCGQCGAQQHALLASSQHTVGSRHAGGQEPHDPQPTTLAEAPGATRPPEAHGRSHAASSYHNASSNTHLGRITTTERPDLSAKGDTNVLPVTASCSICSHVISCGFVATRLRVHAQRTQGRTGEATAVRAGAKSRTGN